ncbi:MAG: insulinase family protein [Gemmatimonadaceae bacterium]
MSRLRLPAVIPSALAFVAATLPLTTSSAVAHAQGAPAASRTTPAAIPLDPSVRRGQLANGFTYYIRRNARPEHRVELRLVVNAGSVLEDDDQRGMAHFVEHMLFNGTNRFKKNDIVSYLESIGVRFGADLNAYTGFDETVYILPVPTDKPGLLDRGLDILEDWASGASFDSTQVIGERGVVLEEWRRGLGADARIRDKQFPVFFQGSRYAERLPIGLPDVIQAANPAPLKRFYRDWYRPNLMALVAVGDIDPVRTERLVRERFGKLRNPAKPRPRTVYKVPGNDTTLVTIATDKEQDVSTVLTLYKQPQRTLRTRTDYRRLLVDRLYNNMLNDRFSEIGRRTNAPFSFASSSYGALVRSSDVYQLAALVKDGDALRGLTALLQEARRVDVHGFLPAELARAKTEMLRSLESAFAERDKSESARFAGEYIAHFLSQEPSPGISYEFAQAKAMVPGITIDEVNALGRQWISDKNRIVAVSAPDKPNVTLPSASDLLKTFRAADTATVSAWTETVSAAPMVPSMPAPGRVVAESTWTKLGMTEWHLSNGVRVLVKPTDFKADELLLRAWSPGGSSLVADSDFVNATLATLTVERGGVGDIDAISLTKKLVGKQVAVAPVVDNLTEGFSGRASPKDLETLMQLIYLKFTSPRRDSVAFDAFRAQVGPFFANRANNPDAVFGDTVIVTMGQHHPRAKPINKELLDSASFARAFAIYRDRFADASDFTFLFVGNVDPLVLRPLTEQWLGSLPSLGRHETWKDVGMRAPVAGFDKVVRKGVEPKSTSLLFFSGEAEFTPANRHALRSLAELLEMQLLDTLREALGGTYSVSVNGETNKYPRPEYSLTISFGSAPERADSLYSTIRRVIAGIQANGPDASYVQKVREQQQRSYEVDLRENSYWLANLAARLENGEDPNGLLSYGDFIRGLTASEIQEAARKYIDLGKAMRFVLLPEKPAS